MGFDIDINKLTGEWKQWAESADTKGDGDKRINSIMEVDDVISQALAAGKNDNEIASVFGLKTNETDGKQSKAQARATTKSKEASEKRMRKEVFNKIETANFNDGDWDKLAGNLTASMLSQTQSIEDRIYYSKLSAAVRSIANEMKNHPFSSKKDVKKLEDQVKDALKISKNDEFKDFKNDVIEMFVEKAESYQRQTENNAVSIAYDIAREQGLSREDAIKEIAKNKDFKGSYFPDGEEFALNEARDVVWDAIEIQKGKGITDGKEIKKAVIADLTERGQYDKFAEKALDGELSIGEKLKWDRSQVKSFRKYIAAYNRAEDAKAKAWTKDEIVDELKTKEAFAGLISNKTTITDEQGNKTQEPLIKEKIDKDGNITYDITNLSNLIAKRIGDDLRANRQESKLSPYSELENIRAEISAVCGCDIKKSDAKRLVKMCGYDLEGKNWAQIIYNAVVGTAIDAVSAGAGMLLTKPTAKVTTNVAVNAIASYIGPTAGTANFDYSKDFPITVNAENNNHLELLLNVGSSSRIDEKALKKSLLWSGLSADNFKVESTENGLKLVIDSNQSYSETFIKEVRENLTKVVTLEELGIDPNDPKNYIVKTDTKVDADADPKYDIGSALWKTALFSFALNLLREALKEQGEIPVLTTQFSETDINQYLAKLSKNKKLSPTMFNGIKLLALTFMETKDGKPVEGGKWDVEKFKLLLNKFAGDESFLNKYETAIGLYEASHGNKYDERSFKAEESDTTVDVKELADFRYEQPAKEDDEYETKMETTLADSYTPKTTEFTAWQDVVNGYPCFKNSNYSNTEKIRIAKVLQAMDLTKVSADADIKSVYNLDKIAEFARTALKEDIDAAMAKYPDFPIKKDAYLAVLNSAGGVKGNVVVPELYDKDGNEFQWQSSGRVNIKHGKGSTTTVDVQKRTVNGETHYYKRAKGSNGNWTEIPRDEFIKLQLNK